MKRVSYKDRVRREWKEEEMNFFFKPEILELMRNKTACSRFSVTPLPGIQAHPVSLKIPDADMTVDFEKLRKRLYPFSTLEKPYGCWTPSVGKIISLFVFFKQIIIPINPYLNMDSLGLSISEIIVLYKKGFVIPVIENSNSIELYPDIFTPLFELKGKYHVPSSGRVIDMLLDQERIPYIYTQAIQGKMHEKLNKKFGVSNEGELNKNLKQIESEFSPRFRAEVRKIYNTKKPQLLVKYLVSDFIYSVYALTGTGLAETILEELDSNLGNLEVLSPQVKGLYILYCEPFMRAIGGYVNYDYETVNSLKTVDTSQTFKSSKHIIIPRDFIVEFTDSFSCDVPLEVKNPLRFIYKIRKEQSVEENFKFLRAINDDFNKGKFRDVLGRIKGMKEVMYEMNAKIGEIERSSKRVKNIIKVGSVLIPSASLPLGIQVLSRGDLASIFTWVGICATNILMGKYDEELSKLFIGLRFKKTGTPFLLWQHKEKR